MKRSLEDILFYIFFSIVPLVIAVAAIPYLISHFGVEKFGYLSLFWVLIGYFSIFDLGLGRVMTREVSVCLASGKQGMVWPVIKSITKLMLGLALVGALVVVVLSHGPWLEMMGVSNSEIDEIATSLRWLALGIPGVIFFSAGRGLLEAFHRFRLAALLRAIVGSWSFVGPVVAIQFDTSLSSSVLAISLVRFLVLLVPLFVVGKILRSQGFLSSGEHTEPENFLRMAGWMTVSNVVSPIMVYFDRFALAAMLGPAAVAYYSTPYDVVSRLSIIPESVFSVMFPKSARAHASQEKSLITGHLAIEATLGVFMAVVASLALAVGRQVLDLWLGPEFGARSWQILVILSGGLVMNFVARASFNTLQAAGKAKLTAFAHLIEVPIYGVIFLILVTRLGVIGAALAWSIRAGLDLLLLRTFLASAVEKTMRRKAVDVITFTFSAAVVLASFLPDATQHVAAGAVLLIVAVWSGASYMGGLRSQRQ